MRVRAVIIAGLALLAAGPASAQQAVVEGAGVEISEGTVLHPSVGLETGVISNVFYEDTNATTAPIMRVVARMAMASQANRPAGLLRPVAETFEDDDGEGDDPERTAPSLDFRLTSHVGYLQYLHPDVEVSEQSRLTGGLQGHAVVFPAGPVSLVVDELLERDTRPRNFESMGNLNRWINIAQAGAHVRPGNGALEFSLRYVNFLDVFESENASFANRMNHLLRGRAEWQFLPVTRFLFEASYGFFGPLGASEKPTSTPLRVQLGAATAITEATSVRAHAGYGKGFYAEGEDFSGLLFGAELGLRYSPTGRFTVAYEHDYHDSINANYYRDHAILARVDQQIDTFILDLRAELRLRGYRGVFASVGPPARDDLIMGLRTRGYYMYRDWLAFTAHVDAISDITEYRDNFGDDPSYNRLEVLLGALAAF